MCQLIDQSCFINIRVAPFYDLFKCLNSYWIFHIAHIFPQSYIFSTKLPNDYCYLFNNDKYFRNTDGLLWFVKNVLPHVDIDFKILEIIVLLNANRASSNSAQNIVTTQPPIEVITQHPYCHELLR